MTMDWKDLLSQKIESGELTREDSTPAPDEVSARKPDTLNVLIATIVEGFTCPDDEVASIASRLKTRLGTGGSSRGGEILIQGDVADKVRAALREMGYKVR